MSHFQAGLGQCSRCAARHGEREKEKEGETHQNQAETPAWAARNAATASSVHAAAHSVTSRDHESASIGATPIQAKDSFIPI